MVYPNLLALIRGGTFYEVNVDNQDDYIWFSLDFGSSIPRDKKLTNVNTGAKRDNSRAIDEAELNGQVFFLFRFSTGRLYASSRLVQMHLRHLLSGQNTAHI